MFLQWGFDVGRVSPVLYDLKSGNRLRPIDGEALREINDKLRMTNNGYRPLSPQQSQSRLSIANGGRDPLIAWNGSTKSLFERSEFDFVQWNAALVGLRGRQAALLAPPFGDKRWKEK